VKSLDLGGRVQSPDGRFLWNTTTPSTEIDDADGHQVGSIAGYPAMWADDSRQLCAITYRPYTLGLETLDGKFHPVGAITLPPAPTSPPPNPELAACSVLSGRAIVVGQSTYIWSLTVISLADGSVIYERRYPNPLSRLVASHDGHYAAEQLAGNAQGNPTLIRELPSGNVVAQLGGIIVQGFSWDGSLVAGATGTPAALNGAEVLRWQTNQAVWRCDCPSLFETRVLAQPDGTKLAIAATDQHAQGTLTIVDASGSAQPVPVANQSLFPAF